MAEEASSEQGEFPASTTSPASCSSTKATSTTPQVHLRTSPHANESRAIEHNTSAQDNRAVERHTGRLLVSALVTAAIEEEPSTFSSEHTVKHLKSTYTSWSLKRNTSFNGRATLYTYT
jgi:hypothetical protein